MPNPARRRAISAAGTLRTQKSAAVESFEPRGPFGAKEIGEGSLLPALGAIANAIYDACGVRVKELPITPEKILRGLEERRAKEAAAAEPKG